MSRRTVKWGCPAAANDFACEGRVECFSTGDVRIGSHSHHMRARINPNNLRSKCPLLPVSRKFQRLYNARSAIERFLSRIDGNLLMHDHFIRGRKNLQPHLTLGMTIMLAAACNAIEADQPEKMRSIFRPAARTHQYEGLD